MFSRFIKAIPHNSTRTSSRLIFRLFPRRNLEKPPVFLRFLSENRQKNHLGNLHTRIVRYCLKIIICLLPVFNLPGLVSCRRVPDDSSPKINWSDYVIITPAAGLPQEDSGFGEKTNLLNEVKTAIEEVSGYYPEHFSGNAPEHEHEILLGFTTRQESQVLREELRERDFIVAYRNGSFIVCGGSDEALVSAVRVFIREIRNGLRGTEDREIVKAIPHNSRACIGERFLCLF